MNKANYVTGPFATTIFVALLITVYMIMAPAKWLSNLMQFTKMSWDYELFLIALGPAYFAVAWAFAHLLALKLATLIGSVQQQLTGKPKQRNEYKVIAETSRI